MTSFSMIRHEALQTAQGLFRKGNLHPAAQEFRRKILNDYGFYDGGLGQWLASDIDTLRTRGQEPITVNVCKGFIDNLSGVEIQSRYRSACRNDSSNPEDDKMADALTHLLYYIQEDQSIPYKESLKFRDSLVCGIGWSHIFIDDYKTNFDYVHPYNMVPDPDDLSPQYTNMQFVCRKFWLPPEMVKKRWKNATKDIDLHDSSQDYDYMMSQELMDRNSTYTAYTGFQGTNRSRLLVIEVQYKKPARIYCGFDESGKSFETFDLDYAEQNSINKKEITEKSGDRIMRSLFFDNTLLEHAPLDHTKPNQKDFSYVPLVHQRAFSTGVPYGLMECMKDMQRDCNARITKSVYSINSSRLIFEGQPLPGMPLDKIQQNLKDPASVIVLPKESNFKLSDNTQLGEEQIRIVELYLTLIQRVTGINDEMLGIQTNATSAVAQNVRQVNSVRNNVFAFDNISQMKKREARLMLDMTQSCGLSNSIVEMLSNDERESIILNFTYDADGKTKIANDIRHLPISLYIEEVPDYQSSFAEQRSSLEALLNNPQAPLIMRAPELMRRLGIRNADKLSQEILQAMQQQAMAENPQMAQMGQDMPGGGGMSALPSPGMPMDQSSPSMQLGI